MTQSYILLHPTQPDSGLFAFIWQTIRGIYHNPDRQYYFYFGHECCYYNSNFKGFNNAWDYYFKQPHIQNMPNFVEKEVGLIFDFESEFREGVDFNLNYNEYNNRRFIFNDIIKKYYILNDVITEKIDTFYTNNFKNKKVLGIHCRGTDHPNNTDITKYLKKIENIANDYDIIFATSDEQSKIDILIEYFGNKLITYPTFRSPNGLPIHISLRHLYEPNLIGEEVLIEAYLLSKTDLLLLYTDSNVNFYVRALNPNLPYINL
jgi:hypothetical protein